MHQEQQPDYMRQTDLFNPEEYPNSEVTVAGLGNIGSHTALALARLGISRLLLYDPDTVEPHNAASQAFSLDEVGQSKATAIREKIKAINPACNVCSYDQKLNTTLKETPTSPIIVIAVDSMEERRNIHRWMEKNSIGFDLLIDGRIGGEQLEVHTARTLAKWKETFMEKPSREPCGGRYICYVSLIIAGIIASFIKKQIKGEQVPASLLFHAKTLDLIKT